MSLLKDRAKNIEVDTRSNQRYRLLSSFPQLHSFSNVACYMTSLQSTPWAEGRRGNYQSYHDPKKRLPVRCQLVIFRHSARCSWRINRTIGSCPDPTWRTVCSNAVDSKQTASYSLFKCCWFEANCVIRFDAATRFVLSNTRHFIAAAAKTNTAGCSWLRIDLTVFLQSRTTILIRGVWTSWNCAQFQASAEK